MSWNLAHDGILEQTFLAMEESTLGLSWIVDG